MSLRLKTEDALASRLASAAGKPAEYIVQAGHRIADLQLPAVIVHSVTSEPVVEGSAQSERKVMTQCSILTPLETTTAVTTHRAAFEWLNSSLSAITALSSVTFMGGYLGSETTGSNDKVQQDSVQYTAFVSP